MPIAGDYPESGVRIVLERDKASGPPWEYRGAAFVPERRLDARVVVTAAGEVTVTVPPDAPRDLAEKVRLIVRTAYRQAEADGEPPAWRIVRWRGEK